MGKRQDYISWDEYFMKITKYYQWGIMVCL